MRVASESNPGADTKCLCAFRRMVIVLHAAWLQTHHLGSQRWWKPWGKRGAKKPSIRVPELVVTVMDGRSRHGHLMNIDTSSRSILHRYRHDSSSHPCFLHYSYSLRRLSVTVYTATRRVTHPTLEIPTKQTPKWGVYYQQGRSHSSYSQSPPYSPN